MSSNDRRSSAARVPLVIGGLLVWSLVMLAAGIWLERSELVPQSLPGSEGTTAPAVNDSLASSPLDAPTVRLELGEEALAEIAERQEKAVRRDWLVPDEGDFVPGSLAFEGEEVGVWIRLDGNSPENWSGDKWTLRVEAKKPLAALGFSWFRLRTPESMGLVRDWFLARALEREGFYVPEHRYVQLVLNGEPRGVHVMEEAPRARLRYEGVLLKGPIVTFEDGLSWSEAADREVMRELRHREPGGEGQFLSAIVRVDEPADWASDDVRLRATRRAMTALDAFRRGEFTTAETFDLDKLARFLAITDLLGATPVADWRALRFYYDSLSGRLEPIGFDARGRGVAPLRALALSVALARDRGLDGPFADDHLWLERLFDDPRFQVAYMKAIEEVSGRVWIEEMLGELEDELDGVMALLGVEYEGVTFPEDVILSNRKFIRSALDPRQSVRAHLVLADQTGCSVAVANLLGLPLEVVELDLGKDREAAVVNGPVRLEPRAVDAPLTFQTVRFAADGVDWTKKQRARLEVRTSVLGSDKSNRDPVLPDAPLAYAAPILHPPEPSFREFAFLAVDEDARTLTFARDLCALDRDLVVPGGWLLRAGPGTTIDLQDGAAIVSESALELAGTAEAPVRIRSTDGTGQGLYVRGAEEISTLTHVVIEGMSPILRQGWELSAVVTFQRSELLARDCRFLDARAEDALSVVSASFRLERCRFERSEKDAFDGTFCSGEVVDSSFLDSGNDAIDVASSSLVLRDLVVDGAGDKGVSAGEDSIVRGRGLVIRNCDTALASKNRSRLIVEDSEIEACKVGLAAFQNNDDSGPASISAAGLGIRTTKTKFDVQQGSSLEVDGSQLRGPRIADEPAGSD